jgi:hypothetical protein
MKTGSVAGGRTEATKMKPATGGGAKEGGNREPNPAPARTVENNRGHCDLPTLRRWRER